MLSLAALQKEAAVAAARSTVATASAAIAAPPSTDAVDLLQQLLTLGTPCLGSYGDSWRPAVTNVCAAALPLQHANLPSPSGGLYSLLPPASAQH